MRAVPTLLRENREFRNVFTAHSISLVGDQIALIALPLTAVLVLDANAAQMGYLTAAGLVPYLLFSLHAGAWVDRSSKRRRTMIVADIGRALVVATVPLAYWLDVLTIEQLLVTEFLIGSLAVLFSVADTVLFISVVPRERYVEGQSLLNGSRAFSYVAGPTLGGLLVQVLTAPVTLVLDACSYVFSAFFLGRIDPVEPPKEEAKRGHVVAGLRFIRDSEIVRASLLATATVNFFNFVFWALFVLYVTRELGISPGTLGLVPRRRRRRRPDRLGNHRPDRPADRDRARVRRRLHRLPGAARARAARRGPGLGDRLGALPGRVRLGNRRDDDRHQRRRDVRGADPAPTAGPCVGRLFDGQLRRAAAGLARRRGTREHDRAQTDALDRHRRCARGRALAPTVADSQAARAA